jgi:hypothetical protein
MLWISYGSLRKNQCDYLRKQISVTGLCIGGKLLLFEMELSLNNI